MDTEMNKDEKLLLEEYKLCQKSTDRIESALWNTSAAIGIGSMASFIIFISKDKEPSWQGVIIIGFLVFFVSLIWWYMARRWWDIMHTTFLRMKHLEKKLHFFQTHYIYHKDGKLELSDEKYKENGLNEEQLEDLYDKKLRFHLRGVQKWLWLFPWFLLLSSWEYAFYRSCLLLLTFTKIAFLNSVFHIIIFASPFIILIIVNIIRTRIKSREWTKVVKERREYFDPWV